MAQQRETRNILVLYSHEREMATYAAFDKVLRSQLESGSSQPLTFYTEYLDLMRFPGENHQQKLMEYLQLKYSGLKVDLIFVVSGLAFDFVIKDGDALFPGVPVVFTSVNIHRVEGLPLKANMTGIAAKRDIRDTLTLALRLHPDTKQVIIPVGTSLLERSWTADLRESLRSYEDHLAITYLTDLPMTGILSQLRNLPKQSIILFSPIFFYDGTGRYFPPEESLDLICRSANSPVYGTDATYLGAGIVGGHLYDMAKTGDEAGKMGARILAGERPANIPVETLDPNYDMFDARQLKRWGLSEAKLPAGSIVEFKQPSLWALYKWYILACAAALLLQSLLVIVLVWQALKLKRSEIRLTILSRHLINAQEEERKRIARELHDDFSQRLALVMIELRLLSHDQRVLSTFDRSKLDDLCSTLDDLSADIHQLSHTLHSSKLHLLGLKAALKELCAQVEKGHHISVDLQASEMTHPVPAEIALCFYRVAQEAINNAVKYSGASRVVVTLSTTKGKLRMQIVDSGKGFDSRRTAPGLGLDSMRERMRLVHGELLVSSKPGAGTELMAQVMLKQSFEPRQLEIA